MPVINLTRVLEIALKIALFSIFAYFLITSINNFTTLLMDLVSHISSNGSAVSANGLNLGCVAEKIGLVAFLNSLFIIVYNAIGLYISASMSVIVFKFTSKAYTVALKL